MMGEGSRREMIAFLDNESPTYWMAVIRKPYHLEFAHIMVTSMKFLNGNPVIPITTTAGSCVGKVPRPAQTRRRIVFC